MSIKKTWAFVALCGLSLIAVPAMAQDDDPIKVPLEKPAQQASPPAPSQTPTVPATYKLEVDQNDLAAISTALMELPKKVADPLINKLNMQLQQQIEAAKKPPATAPGKE